MPSGAGTGRSLTSLIQIYVEQLHRSLSNNLKVSDNIYTSIFQGLTLRIHYSTLRAMPEHSHFTLSQVHIHVIGCPKY